MNKGPWFWNFEGCWVIKREVFDEHGEHAGYELLDGDYTRLEAPMLLLLSAWQHVSHGGPTRGQVEDVLRTAGVVPQPAASPEAGR